MAKKVTPSPAPAAADSVTHEPNSRMPAFPSFNQEGIYQAGISKTEYVTAHFVAGWVQAHGKIPDFKELQQLMELAILTLNVWVPEADRVDHVSFDNEEELLP
jgi:hypothetical protein